MILITCLLVSVAVYADDGLPIVEVKADRTIIYPQRMELNGEETLMDVWRVMKMSSPITTSASTMYQ